MLKNECREFIFIINICICGIAFSIIFKEPMKREELNPWDDEIVPRKKLDEIEVKGRLRNVQREIGKMSRKRSPEETYKMLTIYLKRSLQLSYIEPWFQFFLPPRLKGRLFIATIGKYYWVIGTPRGEFGAAFNFYQKEIRKSLETHLNKISKKRWKIPPFRISIMPENPNTRAFDEEIAALMQIKSVPMKSQEERRAMLATERRERLAKQALGEKSADIAVSNNQRISPEESGAQEESQEAQHIISDLFAEVLQYEVRRRTRQ